MFLQSEGNTHATFRFAVEELGIQSFDDRLIVIDEFHHVSSNPDSILGTQLTALIARDKVHVVAMTGSYFRGDSEAVLSPADEAKFETVTYTYYEQLNGYTWLKSLDIGYFFYTGPYVEAIHKVLIFTDINGRSKEILDLLGIDQRARFKHVHCPLPDHDDRRPSFRVDPKTERFICTCLPRGGSMIDLVIGMGHASNFVEATRWLRKNLFGYATQYKQVNIPNDFVTTTTDTKEIADRTEILRVLSKCIEVPPLHPYVVKKGILPLCALYEPILKNLVIPIHDKDFLLRGFEYIYQQDNKFCVDGTRSVAIRDERGSYNCL